MEFAFMRPENISGMMTPDPAAIVARGQEFLFCPVNAGRLMSFCEACLRLIPGAILIRGPNVMKSGRLNNHL
jgi:hypothetical protein